MENEVDRHYRLKTYEIDSLICYEHLGGNLVKNSKFVSFQEASIITVGNMLCGRPLTVKIGKSGWLENMFPKHDDSLHRDEINSMSSKSEQTSNIIPP